MAGRDIISSIDTAKVNADRKGRRGRTRRLVLVAGALLGAGMCALWLLIPPYGGDLDDYGAGTKIYDCKGQLLRKVMGKEDVFCEPVSLSRTGDWVIKALVASEDKRFFRHMGVDPIAVCRAVGQNVMGRRIVSGASTLSTLVIKLTEPRPRTLLTKIVEAHHAFYLEKKLSKNAILEQYLNRAPFGSNIRGIQSASQRYYGKSVRDLSLAESALLVGLPRSPTRLRPDRYLSRALKRKDYVLHRMLACGYITSNQYEIAARQSIVIRQDPLPFHAPHFCDFILKKYPGEPKLKTTLDMDYQRIAEDVLQTRLGELADLDISGGAVVILDVRTGAVRAMVGSPDFRDDRNAGQFNAATARRSPGSALKPFAYAMAMEQGIYTPETIVADVPVNFRGYTPKNFNLNYCGPVTVRYALVNSLNIPALRCVQNVGLENFVRNLRSLQLSTLNKPAGDYGLSIVIGTCEVTLLELANAYACLAREGIYRPLHYLEKDNSGKATRLFSKETAYMIADILSGDERSFDFGGHVADVTMPRIAWKTGTSNGYRDAWTLAYNPEYVVGVWIGNPDGRPSRGLVGSVAAAPVAYEIFRRIYSLGNGPWYKQPATLPTRQVCARSGAVPREFCPTTITDYYIPGISLCQRCRVHRRVKLADGHTQSVTVQEVWPHDIELFLDTHGMRVSQPAGARTDLYRLSDATTVRITTPNQREIFRFLKNMPYVKQGIQLAATSSARSSRLYWFVDNELYSTADSGQSVFWPLQPGRHVFSCSDDTGNSDNVEIMVE